MNANAMKPPRWIAALALALVLPLPGCASNLIEERPAPVRYELRYESPASAGAEVFGGTVRVGPLTAADPYGGTEMVVLQTGRRVETSVHYQWIAPPPRMLGDRLTRDLARSGLFAEVTGATSSAVASYELTGRVDEFAWDRREAGACAVLDVQVSLTRDGEDVLFTKHYQLESPSSADDSSRAFADAMSELARRLSEALARDLRSAGAAPAAPTSTESQSGAH